MRDYEAHLQQYVDQTEQALDGYLTSSGCQGQELIVEAMRYSALAGGKRLRPALTMEFCRVSGGMIEDALPFACALEMIHTYSLIHDDLPCMDNDDFRRGKPTNHKVYGEGMAVLAGDALLTCAFETALRNAETVHLRPQQVIQAVQVLAHEAGYYGMIGGQALDLTAENEALSYDALVQLQRQKTGALIRAAAKMGCIAAGATDIQIQAAETYADKLGLAFQIQDDILDIEGDAAIFGKPIGSDEKSGKSTFPKLLGMETCKDMVRSLTAEAIDAVRAFENADFLVWLANHLAERRK